MKLAEEHRRQVWSQEGAGRDGDKLQHSPRPPATQAAITLLLLPQCLCPRGSRQPGVSSRCLVSAAHG